MTTKVVFPPDHIDTEGSNFNLVADYLEISAFFSQDSIAYTSDLINIMEIGAEGDYLDVDEEMKKREDLSSNAVECIERRIHALGESYPFLLDKEGDVLKFTKIESCYGRAAYMLSLILSNIHPLSEILNHPDIQPTKNDIDDLRRYFQSASTVALAAEVHGRAWSFGFPRSDHSGFHKKLQEIWRVLKDGTIRSATGAPALPKDDRIDVFAARPHRDGLPGFLFAAAQVATGKQWKEKSIRDHLKNVFPKRWFGEQPVTEAICYHIIPFDRTDEDFVDDCRTLGNVLHRLRVPVRVAQARELHEQGLEIESYDVLECVISWLNAYSERCKIV